MWPATRTDKKVLDIFVMNVHDSLHIFAFERRKKGKVKRTPTVTPVESLLLEAVCALVRILPFQQDINWYVLLIFNERF